VDPEAASVLKRYIIHQKQHHGGNTLRDGWGTERTTIARRLKSRAHITKPAFAGY